MNKDKALHPPAETRDTVAHEPMRQWRDAALNSEDFRNRIAVTAGLSRGIFGCQHLAGAPDSVAANDDDYIEEKRCA